MTEEKTGDCFEVAGNIISTFTLPDRVVDLTHGSYIGLAIVKHLGITEAHELALVHGMVTRHSDQLRHSHAWLEWVEKGLVLDFSNGHQHIIPRALYYKAGSIKKVFYYSVDASRHEMVESAHYGPWHEDLIDE